MTLMQMQRPVGELLRDWREQRRLSQLQLAVLADVSTRHLSFIETGRSQPSREMVQLLAEHLDLPLRERNQLLLAAGFAPVYSQNPLDAAEMSPIRAALRQLLSGHEPYPAVVVDRDWNLVDANDSLAVFTGLAAPELLEPPVNVMRLALHPKGVAPHIVNLTEWRTHLLTRLRRRVALTGDPRLTELYDELTVYPCDLSATGGQHPATDIVVPLRLRQEDGELRFFCTVATFGTPTDITVAELAIESFFPADDHTAQTLIRMRSGAAGARR